MPAGHAGLATIAPPTHRQDSKSSLGEPQGHATKQMAVPVPWDLAGFFLVLALPGVRARWYCRVVISPLRPRTHGRRRKEEEMNQAKLERFLDKLLTDISGAAMWATVLVGEELGLYRALRGAGFLSAEELA